MGGTAAYITRWCCLGAPVEFATQEVCARVPALQCAVAGIPCRKRQFGSYTPASLANLHTIFPRYMFPRTCHAALMFWAALKAVSQGCRTCSLPDLSELQLPPVPELGQCGHFLHKRNWTKGVQNNNIYTGTYWKLSLSQTGDWVATTDILHMRAWAEHKSRRDWWEQVPHPCRHPLSALVAWSHAGLPRS